MQVAFEDSVVARQKSEEILQILEKIICERCGMDVDIRVSYIEPTEKKNKKNSNIRIQNEVHNIISQSSFANGVQAQEQQTISQEVQSGGAEHSGADEYGNPGRAGTEIDENERLRHGDAIVSGNERPSHTGKSSNANQNSGKKNASNFGRGRKESYGSHKRSDNPDVIYGRDFEEEAIPLEQIVGEIGEVIIRGKVQSLETREIRNEKTIIFFAVTDYTDTIMVKMFAKNEIVPEITAHVKKGAFLKIKGVATIDKFDGELTIGSVTGMKKIADFTSIRMDNSPQKRVELHCHTKMSDMDGVSEIKDIIGRAKKWGHPALAVTDHGDVQAFPDAGHAVSMEDDFKVIYGVEAYLVDD